MTNVFEYDEIPVVQTKAGKVKGYRWNGINIFKGIEYAQAERFQMPKEPKSWEGVKETASYGYVCPLLNKPTPTTELFAPHRYWPENENCLNLNIWTPSLDNSSKKPVMVWLHGGAYRAGSSIEQIAYDGFNMSTHGDVIVITVNHRLNILGFLDLSLFGEKYKNSANAGLADLVSCLKWIQDNIANFGGDKDNVTIFGQSGGGMKVSGLMQIPEADGLYHKAIIMSGVSDGGVIPVNNGNGKEIVTALMSELNIPIEEVERLEKVPYCELANAYNKVSPNIAKAGHYVGCVPIPNNYYMGEPLLTNYRDYAKQIPLLLGSVFGEFAFGPLGFNKYTITDVSMNELFQSKYGNKANEVIEIFKKSYPDKPLADVTVVDRSFRVPTKKLARLHAESGEGKVYLYQFALDFPYQNGKVAWHCSDIPFVFKNTDKVEVCNIPGVTERLENQIFNAFIQFAKTGNPNHEQLPNWKEVTTDEEPTMIFDRVCEVKINYDDDLLDILGKI